ncbi:MAG: MarR family transcriptional regulator [Anderseniella sp.]|jgi:DNA-binding MarR family transcriptional regulator|nr:MarR family transcriptional regulator [Anderseniella sp.]
MASDAAQQTTPVQHTLSDEDIIELIELLYFGYRDFTSDPDALLSHYGFGRAHHRVVHFVGRNPGISVAELLVVLKITKQSLARVLRELVERGFIEQRTGDADRRKRLLYLSDEGRALHARLMAPQMARVREAIAHAGADSGPVMQQLLYGLINQHDRGEVERIVGS